MQTSRTALIVVDMQKYYLHPGSPYARYFNSIRPGCLDYLMRRSESTVTPNIRRCIEGFRRRNMPVVFLRLCGRDPERRDLHRFFMETHERGRRAGFDPVYPLADDPWAEIVDELKPLSTDIVIDKTTFSPFTTTAIDSILRKEGIERLVLTGLATSQCVETTARDASERGYSIVHLEDAQTDYDELTHLSSLISSWGVCGGNVMTTGEYLADCDYQDNYR